MVYVEIRADEPGATATAVLAHAIAWFAARGVLVERVLSDNGNCYRSHARHETCTDPQATMSGV